MGLPPLKFDNYYTLFDVQQNFTQKELKKGYQNLVRVYHPDKNKDVDTTDIFQQIRKAFECLSDDNERAIYDKKMRVELLKKEKEAKADKKRSRMKAELDERERVYKVRKMEEQQRRYSKEQNISKESQENYEKTLVDQQVRQLKQKLLISKGEGVGGGFSSDFIVLKWNATKSIYSKDDLLGIFSSFGSIKIIEILTDQLAILVFRKDDGAIKLMHSVQEGKNFGIPSNRININWANQQSQEGHFAGNTTTSSNISGEDFKRSKNSKTEKTFQKERFSATPVIPSLEEHLALEKEVLNMLLDAANEIK